MLRIFLLSIFVAFSYAQDTHVYWETINSPNSWDGWYDDGDIYDMVYSNCEDDQLNQNYICVSGSYGACGQNGYDLAILKYNYDGSLVFHECINEISNGGSSEYIPSQHAMALSNNFLYIVVLMDPPNELSLPYDAGYGEYILKTDLNGNIVWGRYIEDCSGECLGSQFYYIETDLDGNILIAGDSSEYIIIDGSQSVRNFMNVAKYDTEGNELWTWSQHVATDWFNNWGNGNDAYDERVYSIAVDDNNDILFGGYAYFSGSGRGIFGKLSSSGGLEWIVDPVDTGNVGTTTTNSISTIDDFIYIFGTSNNFLTAEKYDTNGSFINDQIFSYCYNNPYHICDSYPTSSYVNADGNIIIGGSTNFTNQTWLTSQASIVVVDQYLNILSTHSIGDIHSDVFHNILPASDGSIIASGSLTNPMGGEDRAAIVKISYASGCTNSQSCNYNQYADYNDGSCWETVNSCTCDDGEGAVDDICGECNGNGYDTCDNDEDGTSNYDQWGYGAYNIALEDIPSDYGGGLYMTFNKSFYDQDGAGRNEFYTVERLDETGWVSLNSISAYAQESYTTEVSTQFDGSETEFRVIATMDEGTYISTQSGFGTSVDNLTVLGCMDIDACNYYSQATLDDGSCEYPQGTCDCGEEPLDGYCGCGSETIDGCGECTLDPTDTDADGLPDSCDACPLDADNDADGDTVCGDVDLCDGFDDLLDTDEDGVVDCLEVDGCMDSEACNFIDTATDDDGTCFYGYVFCIDFDEDGLGDPAFSYSDCDETEPNPGFVANCDDLCPDDSTNDYDGDGLCDSEDPCLFDPENDIDGDGLCSNVDDCPYDPDNDIDGDGLCGDVDPYPNCAENDNNGNGASDCAEVFGCMDENACNFDSGVNVDDGSCDYNSCFAASIISIEDIPDDQGGRLYLSFEPSVHDDGMEGNEFYTIQRLDFSSEVDSFWVSIVTGSSGEFEYIYEVSTNFNNIDETFRVLASMNEGTFISEEATGFSIDNISPETPENFRISSVDEELINFSWDEVLSNDLSSYIFIAFPGWSEENLSDNCNSTEDLFEWQCGMDIDVFYDFILLDTTTYTYNPSLNPHGGDYYLCAVDVNGNLSNFIIATDSDLSNDDLNMPTEFALKECYPNPFNPTTTITYQMAEFANVSIDVYNLNGQLVESLYKGFKNPGEHSINWNASNVTSGAYLVTMTSGSFIETQKVMLLK